MVTGIFLGKNKQTNTKISKQTNKKPTQKIPNLQYAMKTFHSDREKLFLWCLGTSQEKNFLQYDASCGAVRREAIQEVDGTEECHMKERHITGNIHKWKTAVVMNY